MWVLEVEVSGNLQMEELLGQEDQQIHLLQVELELFLLPLQMRIQY